MGLIKAAKGSIKSTLADQWIDFFYCDSLSENILAVKGKRHIDRRSSNTKGSDNFISSGSVIAVADGQCMMIVEQGRVVDICSNPGEYIFDSERSQGIFTANDSDEAVDLIMEEIQKRFAQGGQTTLDQRIYYFNTKEILGNRFGTPSPVPFRVVDNNIGLDMDVSLTGFGTFSYRIADPSLFYKNVTGNIIEPFKRERIDEQLESEVISVLQPVFARLSTEGIRYSSLPLHTEEFCKVLNEVLSEKWSKLRGLEIVSVAIKGLKAKEDDEKMIKELQRNAAFRDPTMAAAQLVGAQSEAMKAAASNTQAGATAAFMGMNMASNAGGMNAQDLFRMGRTSNNPSEQSVSQDGWTCSCGSYNTTKFCPSCGNKRPEMPRAAFCGNCGYRLSDGEKTAKYCPNCGAQL